MIYRILLITSITFLASASAQMMQEYSLNDGAGIRSYTVACDELHCRPIEGTDHSFKIQPQKNTSETASYAAAEEIRKAASFDLVLYETGKPRIARFRKSLSRRILVTMDGTIRASQLATTGPNPAPDDSEVPMDCSNLVALARAAGDTALPSEIISIVPTRQAPRAIPSGERTESGDCRANARCNGRKMDAEVAIIRR